MPEVIEIRPKGIYVKIEFSLDELKLLKEACEHCEIQVDLRDPVQAKVNAFFTKEFYPLIDKVVKDLDHGS